MQLISNHRLRWWRLPWSNWTRSESTPFWITVRGWRSIAWLFLLIPALIRSWCWSRRGWWSMVFWCSFSRNTNRPLNVMMVGRTDSRTGSRWMNIIQGSSTRNLTSIQYHIIHFMSTVCNWDGIMTIKWDTGLHKLKVGEKIFRSWKFSVLPSSHILLSFCLPSISLSLFCLPSISLLFLSQKTMHKMWSVGVITLKKLTWSRNLYWWYIVPVPRPEDWMQLQSLRQQQLGLS